MYKWLRAKPAAAHTGPPTRRARRPGQRSTATGASMMPAVSRPIRRSSARGADGSSPARASHRSPPIASADERKSRGPRRRPALA